MKVLVVDEMHPSLPGMLKEIGLEPVYLPHINKDEIAATLAQEPFIGLIIRSKAKVDEQLLQAAKHLKFVARAGAGTDNVDKSYLQKRKIKLVHAAEGNSDAVAEHTLGMILALLNKFVKGHSQISRFEFLREPNRGAELKGKTVGIIGYGYMGRAVAQRLTCLGAYCVYYDIKNIKIGKKYAKPVDLDYIWQHAHIISLHIPLTPENRHWVNYQFFEKCLQKPIIINTSRGEVLVLNDLLQAIKAGIISGAGLDVFENEKFNTLTVEQKNTLQALINTGEVLCTPHVAGWTVESYLKINQVLTHKIKNLIWRLHPIC